jgi:hypothetical protein
MLNRTSKSNHECDVIQTPDNAFDVKTMGPFSPSSSSSKHICLASSHDVRGVVIEVIADRPHSPESYRLAEC